MVLWQRGNDIVVLWQRGDTGMGRCQPRDHGLAARCTRKTRFVCQTEVMDLQQLEGAPPLADAEFPHALEGVHEIGQEIAGPPHQGDPEGKDRSRFLDSRAAGLQVQHKRVRRRRVPPVLLRAFGRGSFKGIAVDAGGPQEAGPAFLTPQGAGAPAQGHAEGAAQGASQIGRKFDAPGGRHLDAQAQTAKWTQLVKKAHLHRRSRNGFEGWVNRTTIKKPTSAPSAMAGNLPWPTRHHERDQVLGSQIHNTAPMRKNTKGGEKILPVGVCG